MTHTHFQLVNTAIHFLLILEVCVNPLPRSNKLSIELYFLCEVVLNSSSPDEGPETENDSDEDIIHSYLPQGKLIHHPFLLTTR